MKSALKVIVGSSAALVILVSFAVLGGGAMLFLAEKYPRVATGLMVTLLSIGVVVTILDLGVVMKTVRSWSWDNLIIVGLTVANIAMTSVLGILFRFFSQPLAGTGLP